MAKYKTLAKTFIPPHLLAEGVVFEIGDGFEPGPHLEPLDEAANAAFEKLYKDKPHMAPGAQPEAAGELFLIEQLPVEEKILSIAEAATTGAQKGIADGGKVQPSPK